MSWAPDRTCPGYPRPNCGGRITGDARLCPACSIAKDAGRPNADLRKLYASSRWRRRRLEVLADEPLCPDCASIGRVEPTTEVHHKQRPRTELDFFVRSNLMALCKPCHSRRTQRGE